MTWCYVPVHWTRRSKVFSQTHDVICVLTPTRCSCGLSAAGSFLSQGGRSNSWTTQGNVFTENAAAWPLVCVCTSRVAQWPFPHKQQRPRRWRFPGETWRLVPVTNNLHIFTALSGFSKSHTGYLHDLRNLFIGWTWYRCFVHSSGFVMSMLTRSCQEQGLQARVLWAGEHRNQTALTED